MLTRIISRFWSQFFCRGPERLLLRGEARKGRIDSLKIYSKGKRGGRRVIVGDVHQRRQRQKLRYYNEAVA